MSTTEEQLLSVTDLQISYGNEPAVSGVSFTVGRGEVVAVVGSRARESRQRPTRYWACSPVAATSRAEASSSKATESTRTPTARGSESAAHV